MTHEKIPFFALNYDGREEEALLATLRSKWISMGPPVEEFEAAFADARSEFTRQQDRFNKTGT